MTWKDYRPIPGTNWADNSVPGSRVLRVALVAVDFPDQPFVITMPKGSDLFGNPQVDPVKREQVPQFYADFWGKPGALNHGHTIHEFWMEQSRGKVGIPKIDAFGPYKMPRNLFEYGLNEWGQVGGCPSDFTCNGRMEPDVDALWTADKGADIKKNYDIILRIYAGYDETSVWQEFGEMKFASKEDIPAEWGNPDTTKPRWVATRYVHGPRGRPAPSSGDCRRATGRELGDDHARDRPLRVQDRRQQQQSVCDALPPRRLRPVGRHGSRLVQRSRRSASAMGGAGERRRVDAGRLHAAQSHPLRVAPAVPGAAADAKRPGQSGPAVATVTARAVDPLPGEVAGVTVTLDGDAPQDRTPACDMNADPLCAGDPVFNFYSMEVVQRIGYDSFTPDNGVLIAKNKDREGRTCGYNCFTWVIDARPEDMKMVDFTEPDGTRVMRTIADSRQLNDALFHAGTNSGSQYEWKDEPNRLHFYVVDLKRDKNGILSYVVGVRSLDGAGPQKRDAAVTIEGTDVIVRNTGEGTDIYRLSASVTGAGWRVELANALAAAPQGGTSRVKLHVTQGTGAGTLSVTATSESDPSRKVVVTSQLKAR